MACRNGWNTPFAVKHVIVQHIREGSDRGRGSGGVSTLTELETEVQLRAKWLGGATTKTRYEAYRAKLASFRKTAPFEFRDLPGGVFRVAILRHMSGNRHCRTLDRLHLAAMNELGLRRLLTNDAKQAASARALGYEVIAPNGR